MITEDLHLFVLDGHDGTGKTTLAKRLANELNFDYARPFSGNIGEFLLWLAEVEDYAFLIEYGKRVIVRTIANCTGQGVVFDRHWMTVLSLIPEEKWDIWGQIPPTTLCWVDLPTTKKRLGMRSEISEEDSVHSHYIKIYQRLASHFGCQVLDTSQITEQAALDELLYWVQHREMPRLEPN